MAVRQEMLGCAVNPAATDRTLGVPLCALPRKIKVNAQSSPDQLQRKQEYSLRLEDRRLSSQHASASCQYIDTRLASTGRTCPHKLTVARRLDVRVYAGQGNGKSALRGSQQAIGEVFKSYSELLQRLESAASQQVAASLTDLGELTEPFIAYEVARTIPPGHALFLGNSMPIRDLEAFGGAARSDAVSAPGMSGIGAGLGIPVAANRGASGIDGLISTAAGYAYGFDRAVTLVIGDVSFLHDVNGLNLLRTGEMHPPVTVVLVNNGGGGIFDFLPIASEISKDTFSQLWSTPQNVDLAGMCRAHGLAHQRVSQPAELGPALAAARGLNKHSVVEVMTSRASNVAHHRELQAIICQAVSAALSERVGSAGEGFRVMSAERHLYSLPLAKKVTTGDGGSTRDGAVLCLDLADSTGQLISRGFGEVAPLPGLHRETLAAASQQLELLCRLLPGCHLPQDCFSTPTGFGEWLRQEVGIRKEDSFSPSVLNGLEQALLAALASARGCSVCSLLSPAVADTPVVDVAALLDWGSHGDKASAAEEAQRLVQEEGARALKVKVGRGGDPAQDGELLLAVRQAIGPEVVLRADANRAWSFDEAVSFLRAASSADLQLLEEPLRDARELARLVAETGCRVGLDETLDELLADSPDALRAFLRTVRVEALVAKPAVLGGLSATLALARLAQEADAQVVVSSAFESNLGLFFAFQLAAAVQPWQPADLPVYHGLGTAPWFAANLCELPGPRLDLDTPFSPGVCPVPDPGRLLKCRSEAPRTMTVSVSTAAGDFRFRVLHWPCSGKDLDEGRTSSGPVLFLHGFLGHAEDWEPLAAAVGLQRDCYAVDLPGHGGSTASPSDEGACYTVDSMAAALAGLLPQMQLKQAPILVAYSLGARIVLNLLCKHPCGCCPAAILLSASAGLEDEMQRRRRVEQDLDKAQQLRRGVQQFLAHWYSGAMWRPLRSHPRFGAMLSRRALGDANSLANVLEEASPGRTESLWSQLQQCRAHQVVLVAGELDGKYVDAAHRMLQQFHKASKDCRLVEVMSVGHAVHLEAPEALLEILSSL